MTPQHPSISELLLAVKEFLESLPKDMDKPLRFQALSSAYVLGICRRELELGDRFTENERDIYRQYLKSPTSPELLSDQLCDYIRQGQFDSQFDALTRDLLEIAVNDVHIVKPEHLAAGHRQQPA
jgi:hypothetical protein